MNISMKQEQTHQHRKQTCVCQRRGKVAGVVGSGNLGLPDANYHTE